MVEIVQNRINMSESSEGAPQTRRSLFQKAAAWLGLGAALGVGAYEYGEHVVVPATAKDQDVQDQEAAATRNQLPLKRHLADGQPLPTAGPTNTPTDRAMLEQALPTVQAATTSTSQGSKK